MKKLNRIIWWASVPFRLIRIWVLNKISGNKFNLNGSLSYLKFVRDGGFEVYKQKKYPSGGVVAKSCSCENIPPQPESEFGCKRTIFE